MTVLVFYHYDYLEFGCDLPYLRVKLLQIALKIRRLKQKQNVIVFSLSLSLLPLSPANNNWNSQQHTKYELSKPNLSFYLVHIPIQIIKVTHLDTPYNNVARMNELIKYVKVKHILLWFDFFLRCFCFCFFFSFVCWQMRWSFIGVSLFCQIKR